LTSDKVYDVEAKEPIWTITIHFVAGQWGK